MAGAGREVHAVTRGEDRVVLAGMALCRADVADAAVPMVDVVPMHEAHCPPARFIQVGEALDRKLRPVLRRPDQGLGIGVVVADPWARVGRLHAQPVQHRQDGGGLQRRAVVAVQDRLGREAGDPLGQRRAPHQVRGVVAVVGVVHLPADDLAAVQIQDQVQVEPLAGDRRGQEGHVPAPHLARPCGDVRGRRPGLAWRLGPPAVLGLSLLAQDAGEGGLAGHVSTFVGQHRHDPRRRQIGKARLVGHLQHGRALVRAQRVGRRWPQRLGPAIPGDQTIVNLPALQGAGADAGDCTRPIQARIVSQRVVYE